MRPRGWVLARRRRLQRRPAARSGWRSWRRLVRRQLAPGQRRQLAALACLGAGVLLVYFLSAGGPGVVGARVAAWLDRGMGLDALLLPVVLIYAGLAILLGRPQLLTLPRRVGLVLFSLVSLPALAMLLGEQGGGALGLAVSEWLGRAFGPGGRLIVVGTVAALAAVLVAGEWLSQTGRLLTRRRRPPSPARRTPAGAAARAGAETAALAGGEAAATAAPAEALEEEAASAAGSPPAAEALSAGDRELAASPAPRTAAGVTDGPAAPTVEVGPGGQLPLGGEDYRLPSPELLTSRSRGGPALRRDVDSKKKVLEETLRSFGVEVRVVDAQQGPAVTRFEVQPAPGVKVSRIASLADDIALNLAAPGVRIVAPIPGKAALGIEVPNARVHTVYLRDVLETPEFQRCASPLTVALGLDIGGRPVVSTLDRLVHLLVAGATGSGKSTCVNSLLASLLFKATPRELKLLLIDPKVVELSGFNGIPHLLAPVVTDARRAAGCLRWAVREMERRYEAFAAAGVRDVQRYNQWAATNGERNLPFLVVVIDELADLMMVAPAEVEDAIQRLAQMARAAGIHLVVATQRPSVDVITGVIKANIPSRIAFAVSSQVDSRTILDSAGAEKLLGRGDMLFHPAGAGKPQRVQGAYLPEPELDALLAFIRRQGQPEFEEGVLDHGEGQEQAVCEDDLLPEAVRVVLEAQQASVSILQRRLRIGYTRAGRLMDMMERRGIVGPHQGAKPREILISQADYRRLFDGRAGQAERLSQAE